MEQELKEIILAAWLHDIGKFAQRADIKEYRYSDETRYCRFHEKGGYYSHKHVLYTAGALDALKDFLPDDVRVSNVIELASNHHRPSSEFDQIISEADCLSSGSDRTNEIEEQQILDNEEKKQFYEKPLIHQMSVLKLEEREKTNLVFCKVEALDKDNILPTANSKIGKEDYKKLWEKFESDFKELKNLKFDEYIIALESLLERYWWCIPSSTINDADISLFQHAKTTAAFATCLYYFHKSNNSLKDVEISNRKIQKFVFINGDMSGIQKYIFDLKTSDNNAKLLRARSFQLFALGKMIAEFIIESFDLSNANIITSAGGKFMLILPATENVTQKIPLLQTEIEEYFVKEFSGKLCFILSDGVLASGEDVIQKNLQVLLNKIGDEADNSKQKKMQKAFRKNGHILNRLYEELAKKGACSCCDCAPKKDDSDLCQNCDDLILIGSRLMKSEFIKFNSSKLATFSKMISFVDKNEKGSYSINEFVPGKAIINLPYVAPKKEDGKELKTFENIAVSACGNKKLAMFKADIDNLGLVFSSSLGEKLISFSRYAQMSSQLNYFFSSFYAWFVSENPEYKDKIYTVFSGGDDLCILGAWDSVLDFANEFKKQIDIFTNCNPSVTLSAGIGIFSSNTPVNIMAEMTEELLEKSKHRKETKNGSEKLVKNGITVFDTTVSWPDFDDLLKKGKKLKEFLEVAKSGNLEEGLSTGIVYKMLDFANRAERASSGNFNFKDLLWQSNLFYATRSIKSDSAKELIKELGKSSEDIKKSRIAVSYALYTQR